MPVYFIESAASRRLKIGWAARDVEGRRRQLQAGCWEELRIVRVIPGDRFVESWLHQQFKAHWIRGDWHNAVPEMLTIEPPAIGREEHPEAPRRRTPCGEIIHQLGGITAVAAAMGSSYGCVREWCKQGIAARQWFKLADLAKSTGSPITLSDIERAWWAMRKGNKREWRPAWSADLRSAA